MDRCEMYKSVVLDPTGEHGTVCNAPNAEYCLICELYVCAECHAGIHEAEQPAKKAPVPSPLRIVRKRKIR